MDVVCFGELMIDMIASAPGPLSDAQSFTRFAGGAAANVAAQIRRLGGRPGFLGKLGADGFGDYLLRVLTENGVDTTAVVRDPARRTTVAYITLDACRRPAYLFYRQGGACVNLYPDEVDTAYIRRAQVFYFSTLVLTEEPLRTAAHAAIDTARAAGVLVALDLNYRVSAWPDASAARAEIARVLHRVDVLKVNRDELELLMGAHPAGDNAARMFAAFPALRLLLLTDGADGSWIFRRDGDALRLPAGGRGKPVDTTGAGDSYMGAFLYALVRRGLKTGTADLLAAGRAATTAAAFTISAQGAIPAMPYAADIDFDRMCAQHE